MIRPAEIRHATATLGGCLVGTLFLANKGLIIRNSRGLKFMRLPGSFGVPGVGAKKYFLKINKIKQFLDTVNANHCCCYKVL